MAGIQEAFGVPSLEMLFLDLGGGYMDIKIHKNSSSYICKICVL